PTARKTVSAKSQIIRRRPATTKVAAQVPPLESIPSPRTQPFVGPSDSEQLTQFLPSSSSIPPQDELAQIRALLRPPDILGASDWGIPPPATTPCDPSLETKLAQFHALKHDPTQPKHFNDALMASRAFRNPHLYAKLVEFVGADERSSNFPREIWDPMDVQDGWFADRVAGMQKKRSEEREAAQATSSSNKRMKIDFTSSSRTSVPQQPRASMGGNPYLQHSGGGGMKGGQRKPRLNEGGRGR
ncbi:HCNGP-like protein-domain-containing protein, partial [Vararia minispora EC-137]